MRLVLAIAVFSIVSVAKAQDTTGIDLSKYQKVIMGDDTTWVFVFHDVQKVESDWRYRSMVRRVQHTLPYARTAVDVLSDLGGTDQSSISRTVKRDARQKNKELKKDFRTAIVDMSESEGDVLCKLIYLETGMTAFDIIKKYRGKTKALYWQSIARLGGADLKQKFDPKKDILLNRVLRDIDHGKVRIPDEPEDRAAKKKEKKKAAKATKRSTRKAARRG